MILFGIVRYFIQAKRIPCRWVEKCGGVIWSCCPHNNREKADQKKDTEKPTNGLETVAL